MSFVNILFHREQKRLEEKRREELLSASYNINRTNDHVLNLEYDQNEIRHHNRVSKSNAGFYNDKIILCLNI